MLFELVGVDYDQYVPLEPAEIENVMRIPQQGPPTNQAPPRNSEEAALPQDEEATFPPLIYFSTHSHSRQVVAGGGLTVRTQASTALFTATRGFSCRI